jgi:hypothetical protein
MIVKGDILRVIEILGEGKDLRYVDDKLDAELEDILGIGFDAPADLVMDDISPLKQSNLDNMIYAPSPVQAINFAAKHMRNDDVFHDLGAGVGKVVLSLAIRYPERQFRATEIKRNRAAFIKSKANEWGLDNVTVDSCDVTFSDFDASTFFYMYYPFRGIILENTFARIERIPGARVCFLNPGLICFGLPDRAPIDAERIYTDAGDSYDILLYEF